MKEWYLNTSPNELGGYENQGFLDYKDDALSEVLETDMADTVLLYNRDLSSSIAIRAIIQGNTANTSLNSMERSIIVPIGTLHSGDYILFEDEFWIVDGRPGNNKTYEKAILKECQYKIKWQKSDGTVIERWANIVTASKYDVGERRNNTIFLSTNNYTVTIPYDEDGMTLEGQRIFIDLSPVAHKVFKMTRNDDVLFYHNSKGGTLSYIADKTELNLQTDNQELKLCDYISPNEPQPSGSDDVLSKIVGDDKLPKGRKRTFTALFYDKNGNELDYHDVIFNWNILCDFINKLEIENEDNNISIKINSNAHIDDIFTIQLLIDGSIVNEKEITISSMY